MLCCSVLFTLFSANANAEEVNSDKVVEVKWSSYFTRGTNETKRELLEAYFKPNNGTLESQTQVVTTLTGTAQYELWQTYKFYYFDTTFVATKGLKHSVRMNDVYFSAYVDYADETQDYYLRDPDTFRVLVEYVDGTFLYIDDIELIPSIATVSVSFSFTPEKDVRSIELQLSKAFRPHGQADITRYKGEWSGDLNHEFIVDRSSEEAGLLDGILGFLKTIKDTVINLPSLIWEKISSGLQALFIPSDEYITTFKEDMDVLLSSKLGAIYEVVDLSFNSWDRIQQYDEVNTILFPEVTIPLPYGESFSFGGYDVKIVPDGFESFVEVVKIAVGIVCTVMFVNGLKRKYDSIIER